MGVKVKVCCIASVVEMRMAVRLGADAIGLVSEMPSGPGPIDDTLIAEIAVASPPGLATFLLTCRSEPRDIAAQATFAGTTTVQLVRSLGERKRAELRALMPDRRIVQVVHVTDERSVAEALAAAEYADAVFLNSGNPSAAVPELGGTGRRHDWSVRRTIRDAVPVPVWLAGGLTPENVREAVDTVRPYGVDVCSGLRTNGRLNPNKLTRFVSALR